MAPAKPTIGRWIRILVQCALLTASFLLFLNPEGRPLAGGAIVFGTLALLVTRFPKAKFVAVPFIYLALHGEPHGAAVLTAALLVLGPFLVDLALDVVEFTWTEYKNDEDATDRLATLMFAWNAGRLATASVVAIWSALSGFGFGLIFVLPACIMFWRGHHRTLCIYWGLISLVRPIDLPFAVLVLVSACVIIGRSLSPVPRRRSVVPRAFDCSEPNVRSRCRRSDWRFSRGDLIGARRALGPEESDRSTAASHLVLRRVQLDIEEGNFQSGLSIQVTDLLPDNLREPAMLLKSRALSGTAQFASAEALLSELREAVADPHIVAHTRLALASNAFSAGRIDAARTLAEELHAEASVANRDFYLLLATRTLLAECGLAAGDLSVAKSWSDKAGDQIISNRALRRMGAVNNPVVLARRLFGRTASNYLLAAQTDVLARRAATAFDEERWESEPLELSMAIARRSEDLVELLLVEVELVKSKDPNRALQLSLCALMELDRTRYRLSAQSVRSSWSVRFRRTLGVALDAAFEAEAPIVQAELLEFARVQTLPLAAGESSELILSIPPVVRVRNQARLSRPDERVRPAPVQLEDAAERAAGPGAWWLSYWEAAGWLYWCSVPPAGQSIHAGRTGMGADSPLARTLSELAACLPVVLPGEDPLAAEFRAGMSPLRCSPQREKDLSTRLGNLLIPVPLAEAARAARLRGQRLPVAIAPAACLGYVPWSLLCLPAGQEEGISDRLIEVCDWVLAPSASLIAHAKPASGRTTPLRLAVADTVSSTDLRPLEGARDQARALPADVVVLGGPHWARVPATVKNFAQSLTQLGPDITVAFMCHAVRGTTDEPSRGGIAMVSEVTSKDPEGREQYDVLSPRRIFQLAQQGVPMPAQVLMQACDTSAVSDSASGEWLTIAPAFIGGGSREVMATLFPIPDLGDTQDPLIEAAKAGESLRATAARLQRAALIRWDAGQASVDEHTPISWAAYAPIVVCSSISPAVSPTPGIEISERLIRVVSKAVHETARGEYRIDSGTMVVECLDEVPLGEYFDGVGNGFSPYSFLWTLGPSALARLYREAEAEVYELSGTKVHVSREMEQVALRALAQSARQGVLAEPEHFLHAILTTDSAGSKVVGALSRLSSRYPEITVRAADYFLSVEVARGQTRAGALEIGARKMACEVLHAIVRRNLTKRPVEVGLIDDSNGVVGS